MFCTNCGQEIPDNSSFCTKCGNIVNQTANQAEPNQTYPNSDYGRQPHGGDPVHGYRSQGKINYLGTMLLVIAGISVLVGCVGRIAVFYESIAYLRYIRVLGYEFIVVYAVKISGIAASIFGGIRGIAYSERPDKGKALALNGIIIAALRAADWISVTTLTRSLIDEFTFTWKDVTFGLIPPILLAIGGIISHKALQNAEGD